MNGRQSSHGRPFPTFSLEKFRHSLPLLASWPLSLRHPPRHSRRLPITNVGDRLKRESRGPAEGRVARSKTPHPRPLPQGEREKESRPFPVIPAVSPPCHYHRLIPVIPAVSLLSFPQFLAGIQGTGSRTETRSKTPSPRPSPARGEGGREGTLPPSFPHPPVISAHSGSQSLSLLPRRFPIRRYEGSVGRW